MLLTVTVFLWRAFQTELREPGFRTTGVLLSNFEPRLARYDATRTEVFYRLLKERARTLPGVTSVGMTSVMPLNQDYRDPLLIVPEGYQLPQGTESLTVLSSRIDEGYLDTMGIHIVEGRGIRSSDAAEAPRVALVNQTMASGYWPGQNPIGRRIRVLNRDGQPLVEIVGVTADNKYNWIGEAPTPWMYVAQLQDRALAAPCSSPLAAMPSRSQRLSVRSFVRSIRTCRSLECEPWRTSITGMPSAS